MTSAHYLKFYSGEHHLLINIFNVHSIIETPKVTSISQAPTYIPGVIIVNGISVPLIDTALRLNLPNSRRISDSRSKLIVVAPSNPESRNEYHPIAFTTEDIDDVIALEKEQMQPLPTEKELYDDRLFEGAFEHEQQLMMLLNIDNFYKENFDEILKKH